MRLPSRHLRNWLRNSQSAHELAPTDDDAAAQLRKDIDVAMSDLELLTRPEAGPDVLLPLRLELLGLDPLFLMTDDTPRIAAMQALCRACTHWRMCARDLNHGDVQTGQSTYCLNAEAIDQALVERGT